MLIKNEHARSFRGVRAYDCVVKFHECCRNLLVANFLFVYLSVDEVTTIVIGVVDELKHSGYLNNSLITILFNIN